MTYLAALATALCSLSAMPAEAQLTFSLSWGWAGDARQDAATLALTNTVNRFNAYGDFTDGNGSNVEAAYNAGVPTAQAGYGGWGGILEYGGTWPNDRVTQHELNHWLGSGTYAHTYDGPRTIAIYEQFEGVGERISTDGTHFWPYGLNYDTEWSELNARRNVALMYAARADWGIGSTANPTAWNATSVTLTASDPVGTSGFNYYSTWSDNTFAHPGAAYYTGDFTLRTPAGSNSFTFAGDSLTVNNTNGINGGLLYKGTGTSGVTTINSLTLNDGSYVRHASGVNDLFQLDGHVSLAGAATIDAAQGDIRILSTISGRGGSLNVTGGHTVTLAASNIYSGQTTVNGHLVVEGSTGNGMTTVNSGASLAGAGLVKTGLTALSGSTVRVGQAGIGTVTTGGAMLDDFNSYGTGASTTATGGVWSAEFVGTANSNIVATDQGKSLQTLGGAAWRGAERDLTGTDAAVKVGETQTFFWQVKVHSDQTVTDWVYDFMMGLAPSVDDIDSVDAWADFSVMPFINNAPDTPYINAAGAGTYWAPMSPDTWTNVWVVVNNDAADPTFDLYYSTGTDAPTLVIADADWRNHPAGQDLNAIGFMAAGYDQTNYLVDNIWYATGEDITNPLVSPWTSVSTYAPETLTVSGDVLLQTGATIELGIASNGINDLLSITGVLTAGGTLEVLQDAAAPALSLGDSFDLFDFASATGAFDALNLPTLGSGLEWDTSNLLVTGEISVAAVATLPGDLNGDGYVGLDDLQPILDHWNQTVTLGDASMGDIAGPGGSGPDGYVGLDDLQPVLDHWNEGTPPTLPSANIPEPTTISILGLATLALGRRKRTLI